MAKGKKKSAKKAAKPAKAAKAAKKVAKKAVAKKGKKAAKKAAPAAAGKKAKKSKKGSKKARATGKSKQTSGEETPAPVVDAISMTSLVGRGSSSRSSKNSEIGEGSKAPAFELSDQDGSPVSAKALAGKPYVLYFYPKDDTPGCTIEACDFRDSSSSFNKAGVRVLGVSPDSVQSHDKFRSKFGLNFTLLADPDKSLAKGYGVWALKKNYGKEYMGIVRSTFLVDDKGVVRKAWRGIKAAGHVEKVLEAVSAA
jgi:peroxiredoxin Q/BCP